VLAPGGAGATIGVTGIGVAAIRIGDHAPRCDHARGVNDTKWSDLALHRGLRGNRLGVRVRYGIPEGRQGRHQRQRSQA